MQWLMAVNSFWFKKSRYEGAESHAVLYRSFKLNFAFLNAWQLPTEQLKIQLPMHNWFIEKAGIDFDSTQHTSEGTAEEQREVV